MQRGWRVGTRWNWLKHEAAVGHEPVAAMVGSLEGCRFEVAHWAAKGSANDADEKIMLFAQQHGYIICTQDLDFGLMLAFTGHGKPSVLQIRARDVLPVHIGPQVIQALRRLQRELEAGALVTVDPKKTRVRVLPLRART